ncbi:thiamine pyrophosphate-binding protein [Gordonia sp. NPDC058843]|uniref:thiamine pyrophosphate-binding protein n=1 Tax=Gordonia sp. NPDC058843 TaxID=3346648 RepID=UPI0036C52C20
MFFHETIARSLRAEGVTTIFGVMGDANLYMMDSFADLDDTQFISTSNEAGAITAANGYARVTGGLGVACVTHGPALTNTLTGLVESVKDRTPVLLVAGDTAVVDRDNFQNIAQREVVVPTGAGFEQVRAADTVAEDVAVAVRRALSERRPIVLNVPIEFQWETVEHAASSPRWAPIQAVRPAEQALEDAVAVIATARRPLVLAGQGVDSPEARTAVARLAHRIGAPLGTTLRGRDSFRDDPHNIGIVGTISHEVALDVIGDADTVIAFGAGLNKWTTMEGSVLAGRRVVQVDVDRDALHRNGSVDAVVLGDAGVTAGELVEMLDAIEVPSTGFASPELAARLTERRDDGFVDRGGDGTVDLRSAMIAIENAFPRDRALVYDGGRFIFNAFALFHVEKPRDYVHTVNFGSIGLGMGNAIGAAVGTQRPTLLVTGDGGFMLGGLAEFNTAVRHGLDLVVAVFNDGAYGAEHIQFRRKDLDPTRSTFDWPDFAPVAESLGARGYTVRSSDDLHRALAELPNRDRPVLLDIKLDPDSVDSAGH